MRMRMIVGLTALATAAAWGARVGSGEEDGGRTAPMSEMEMWAKMREWATPGEMHRHLEPLCGKWKISGKMWSSMGAMPFTGEAENRWILGGRFLETTYEGPFMTEAFEGRGFTGYDNGTRRYQSVWIMTMSSAMHTTSGSYDPETKTFTWTGSSYMPDGRTYAKRETTVIESDTRIVSTMYRTPPGEPEFKEMEMIHTRVPAGAK